MNRKNTVAIIHPDLGIGGAEQLIINLALALQSKGYYVKVYTPHFDPNHCFAEARDKLKVEVHGNVFPRTIFGRVIDVILVVWGTFIVSLMVVVLTNTLNMDQS